MTRPFYRSLLFYLGLPGLLFLLWAWVDSNFHRTAHTSSVVASSTTAFRSSTIMNHRGAIRIEHRVIRGGGFSSTLSRSHFDRVPFQQHHAWFPWPQRRQSKGLLDHTPGVITAGITITEFTIPHWLLILPYLLLWSLAFYCRHRRIQRHLTKHPSLPPAQPQTD